MLKQQNKDGYESSRFLYIIEAALEYFVAISVGTVYLAKITGYCGISDEITAILTAFVSLGCGFQFFSVFIGRNMPVKKFVTAGHIVNVLPLPTMWCKSVFQLVIFRCTASLWCGRSSIAGFISGKRK